MGARILVADDSVTIQKVVELTFSKENFELVQARSGEEAIRKAKEVHPDIILVDLVMPDKNGYEVCASLRQDPLLSSVPIILLTGTFESFDKEKGFRAGANDFVTKPFESQLLIGKVKQLLFSKTVDLGAPAAAPPPRPSAPVAPSLDKTMILPLPRPTPPPPTPPPATPPPLELPPPTEEISQDRLWEALDAAPPPSPPGPAEGLSLEDLVPPAPAAPAPEPAGLSLEDLAAPPTALPGPQPPGGLSLEDLAATATPAPAEAPAFDLRSLDLEAMGTEPTRIPTGEVPTVPTTDLEVTPLPESLSLDDLLAETPAPPPPVPRVEPVAEEAVAAEPVFDLTAAMEAPPLPMVEVGKGEPPALAVEDLVGPREVPPAPVAEPELGPAAELALEPGVAVPLEEPSLLPGTPSPAAPLELEELVGPAPTGERREAPLEEMAVAEAPPAAPPPPPPMEGAPILAEAVEAPAPPEIPAAISRVLEAPPLPEVLEEVAAPPRAPLAEMVAPAPPPAAAPLATPLAAPEVGALRQAVTEKVARELAEALSQKLLERIERIVWEVVPELAEILITKEIERIRAIAEDKTSS